MQTNLLLSKVNIRNNTPVIGIIHETWQQISRDTFLFIFATFVYLY